MSNMLKSSWETLISRKVPSVEFNYGFLPNPQVEGTVNNIEQKRVFCRIYVQEFHHRIVGYADGAADPIDFPIAPKVATDRLLAATGIKVSGHSQYLQKMVQFVVMSRWNISVKQCCGSGMFIPDSNIYYPGSRIQCQKDFGSRIRIRIK